MNQVALQCNCPPEETLVVFVKQIGDRCQGPNALVDDDGDVYGR